MAYALTVRFSVVSLTFEQLQQPMRSVIVVRFSLLIDDSDDFSVESLVAQPYR
jgi:hypothetical protein